MQYMFLNTLTSQLKSTLHVSIAVFCTSFWQPCLTYFHKGSEAAFLFGSSTVLIREVYHKRIMFIRLKWGKPLESNSGATAFKVRLYFPNILYFLLWMKMMGPHSFSRSKIDKPYSFSP